MILGISTRWNACRHSSGETLIREILDLGLRNVELGYDLMADLLPGIRKMVADGAINVTSVHSFCPVPMLAPYPSPELFTLASLDKDVRVMAIRYITDTVMTAKEVGARVVVVHAGNVDMKNMTGKLVALCRDGQQYSEKYDRIKMELLMKRDKLARKHLQYLYEGLEILLPSLQNAGVSLALENLPGWESVPTELEMQSLLDHFKSPLIRYWHDMGHAQTRQNLGFIGHLSWLERLQPFLAGMHVHDVLKPVRDHLMPPAGNIDFKLFSRFIKHDLPLVLEPYPDVTAEEVRKGIEVLSAAWRDATPAQAVTN